MTVYISDMAFGWAKALLYVSWAPGKLDSGVIDLTRNDANTGYWCSCTEDFGTTLLALWLESHPTEYKRLRKVVE